MEKIFDGKVAIVTGGSFGIGRAAAVAFAARGAKVIVADWLEDKEQTTLKQIKAAGGQAIFLTCDVSKSKNVQAMIEKTIATYGRLDYAFNNAGIEGATAFTRGCVPMRPPLLRGMQCRLTVAGSPVDGKRSANKIVHEKPHQL